MKIVLCLICGTEARAYLRSWSLLDNGQYRRIMITAWQRSISWNHDHCVTAVNIVESWPLISMHFQLDNIKVCNNIPSLLIISPWNLFKPMSEKYTYPVCKTPSRLTYSLEQNVYLGLLMKGPHGTIDLYWFIIYCLTGEYMNGK